MICFTKYPNLKNFFFFFFSFCFVMFEWGVGGGREGVRGLMEGQTNRPKPLCPFNFFEIGGMTMHKCTSCGPDKLSLGSFYH